MVIVKYSFAILALVSVFGCTSIKVQPMKNEAEITHVCVKDGKEMCFDGQMMGVILDGFGRHGITTQVYSGNLPPECEYNLSYMCNQTWDMAMYMHHAELRLFHTQSQIGYAEYHLNGSGGFSLMKWQSSKTKMDPVIDELLQNYPIVSSTGSVKNIQAVSPDVNINGAGIIHSNQQIDVYTELLKLEDLRKRGILTDAEFEQQKVKLLGGK